MLNIDEPLLSGWVTARKLVADGELPYEDPVAAQRFLERLGVPYVVIRYRKHFRREDLREAFERTAQKTLAPI
jgi:hypothetical protein